MSNILVYCWLAFWCSVHFSITGGHPIDASRSVKRDYAIRECLPFYTKFDNSCYMIYPQKMSWPEAYAFCQAVGANLVHINDKREHKFLKSLAKKKNKYSLALWIGHIEYLGKNIILSGSGESARYKSFIKGEPSTTRGDDCVALYRKQGYLMADWGCISNQFSPICEAKHWSVRFN